MSIFALPLTATGRTWLERQRAAYPFHVGRCLRVTGDPAGMATVYIQCCSGGIFEHDALRLELEAGPGALAHVATSASTVVHSMEQGEAQQEVMVTAAAGAVLEYLPAPLILFPRRGCVTACASGWTTARRSLPAMRCWLTIRHMVCSWPALRWFDRIHSELSVESSNGRLLARDRYMLSGDVLARRLPGVTGPFRCSRDRRCPAARAAGCADGEGAARRAAQQ